MSTNGNYGWKPKKAEKWICPSGQEVWTVAPGPEFALRLGRTPKTFSGKEGMPQRREGQTDEEYARELSEQISDEELVTVARLLLVAMLQTPKLKIDPDPALGEIGPDDTGSDFWPLYNYGMSRYFNTKKSVQVAGGEVEVADLETFRPESGVQGDSMDLSHVSSETERAVEDQGLVGSSGV